VEDTRRPTATRAVAALGALITWCALGLQLWLTLQAALARGATIAGGVWLYLAYFTILTNILIATSLAASAIAPRSALARLASRPGVETTLAASIALVGGGYHVLLSGAWDPRGWVLVANVALHYVTPVVFLVFWWQSTAGRRLAWKLVPLAAAYPLAYFAYVLARGAVTGFYPYPFLDVGALGYPRVLAIATGVAVAYLPVVAALVGISRLRAHRD
jgi:hypothetical protein